MQAPNHHRRGAAPRHTRAPAHPPTPSGGGSASNQMRTESICRTPSRQRRPASGTAGGTEPACRTQPPETGGVPAQADRFRAWPDVRRRATRPGGARCERARKACPPDAQARTAPRQPKGGGTYACHCSATTHARGPIDHHPGHESLGCELARPPDGREGGPTGQSASQFGHQRPSNASPESVRPNRCGPRVHPRSQLVAPRRAPLRKCASCLADPGWRACTSYRTALPPRTVVD